MPLMAILVVSAKFKQQLPWRDNEALTLCDCEIILRPHFQLSSSGCELYPFYLSTILSPFNSDFSQCVYHLLIEILLDNTFGHFTV